MHFFFVKELEDAVLKVVFHTIAGLLMLFFVDVVLSLSQRLLGSDVRFADCQGQ